MHLHLKLKKDTGHGDVASSKLVRIDFETRSTQNLIEQKRFILASTIGLPAMSRNPPRTHREWHIKAAM